MQIACDSTGADGTYEFGVVVGMNVIVNVTYADHTFQLVSNTVANASAIYISGPIAGLDFQVRACTGRCNSYGS